LRVTLSSLARQASQASTAVCCCVCARAPASDALRCDDCVCNRRQCAIHTRTGQAPSDVCVSAAHELERVCSAYATATEPGVEAARAAAPATAPQLRRAPRCYLATPKHHMQCVCPLSLCRDALQRGGGGGASASRCQCAARSTCLDKPILHADRQSCDGAFQC
jgi:hypothetical protein